MKLNNITYNTQDKLLRICEEIYKIEYKRNRMISIKLYNTLYFQDNEKGL